MGATMHNNFSNVAASILTKLLELIQQLMKSTQCLPFLDPFSGPNCSISTSGSSYNLTCITHCQRSECMELQANGCLMVA